MKNRSIYLSFFISIIVFLGACYDSAQNKLGANAKFVDTWTTLGHVGAIPAAKASGVVAVGGADIYYAVYGEGDPLILLHGGLGNTESWANQIPTFAKHYKVIAIDSRGHGRSTRDDATYTIALMTKDVLAVMDDLKIQKARVVGWSDGANIAINMAMNYPSRTEKVFAFGANYNVAGSRDDYETNPVVGLFIEKAQSDYARLSPTPDDFEGFVGALTTGMWEHEPNFTHKQLGEIKAPIAIVFGAHDEFIKLEHAKNMAALIPNSKFILFPNGSHFALWQMPEKFNAAAIDFLK